MGVRRSTRQPGEPRPEPAKRTPVFDIGRLDVAGAVALSARLRAAAQGASGFADACAAVATTLRRAAPVLAAVRVHVVEPHPEPTLVATDGGAAAACRLPPSPSVADAVAAALGIEATGGAAPRRGLLYADPGAGRPVVAGVAAAVGFGGTLPDGTLVTVTAFARVPVFTPAAGHLDVVADGVVAGLSVHRSGGSVPGPWRDLVVSLERAVAAQATDARDEVDIVETLQDVGRGLTTHLDLASLVQVATDAATRTTGAAFGSFFYNVLDERGESYTLYTLSGVPREAFARFPMPRNTPVFASTFEGRGTVRSDDITADRRYGHNPPHHGMPAGHLPVRSYLAVSVISPATGEVVGGFFFGHHDRGRFTDRHERLAEGIAAYTAIAMDNARRYAHQRTTAAALQRAMLPNLPAVPGMAIVSRYLPAATGVEVGGDWMDVIRLPGGRRTAFVVGDVMGRGVHAAAVMGQIRTAVRSYALLDLPPAQVMTHLTELARGLGDTQLITCLYAVHDPDGAGLTYASAGHLPPALITPDAEVTLLTERLGLPLSVGRRYHERTVPFPPGTGLFLYTDGLVEDRRRILDDGLARLAVQLRDVATTTDPETACDKLIADLTAGQHDDDVATLYVRLHGPR